MTWHTECERRRDTLIVRLVGTISYYDADFTRRDEWLSTIRDNIRSGVKRLLVDYSQVSFEYFSSSSSIGLAPFLGGRLDPGEVRFAAVFGDNQELRFHFNISGVERFLDCFGREAQALAFLESDAPLAIQKLDTET